MDIKKVLLLAPMASVHEKFNIANINVLSSLGCEIHIAANFQMDDCAIKFAQTVRRCGYITHHIPFARASLKNNLKCIPLIQELLRQEKFDMVHCHTETGGILIRICQHILPSAKYVYTPHGMSFYRGSPLKTQILYRPIEKWICAGMDINIAMNAEELEVLNHWNAKTANYIHGIGVEIAQYSDIKVDRNAKRKEFGIPENAVVLLAVGELNKNKNHQVILKALTYFKPIPKELFLLVCGKGELRDQLAKQASAIGFGDQLILAGYRNDMVQIYQIADCLVFPSYHEGLPVSVVQGMAAGLPIVASKIRGITDLITHGEGGFLCDPEDKVGFYQGISRCLDNADLRQKMGAYNRQKAKLFDISNVENELNLIYRKVL